jgi:hypothetical protein
MKTYELGEIAVKKVREIAEAEGITEIEVILASIESTYEMYRDDYKYINLDKAQFTREETFHTDGLNVRLGTLPEKSGDNS